MIKSNYINRAKFSTPLLCALLLAGCVCSAPILPEDKIVARMELGSHPEAPQTIGFQYRKPGRHAIGLILELQERNVRPRNIKIEGVLQLINEDGSIAIEQSIDHKTTGLGAIYELDFFRIGKNQVNRKKFLTFVPSKESAIWHEYYRAEFILREGDYNPHKTCFF